MNVWQKAAQVIQSLVCVAATEKLNCDQCLRKRRVVCRPTERADDSAASSQHHNPEIGQEADYRECKYKDVQACHLRGRLIKG